MRLVQCAVVIGAVVLSTPPGAAVQGETGEGSGPGQASAEAERPAAVSALKQVFDAEPTLDLDDCLDMFSRGPFRFVS